MRHIRRASLLTLVGLLFLSGCGQKSVTIKGNLVLPPEVKLEKDDSVTISFIPEVKGPTGNAIFNTSDNSFVADKVPAGKTKVTVNITPYPNPGSEKRTEWFNTNINEVFNAPKTPLSFDATGAAGKSISIDLAAKAVAVK
jgi:hypothetical protein